MIGFPKPLTVTIVSGPSGYRVGSPVTVQVRATARRACRVQRAVASLVAELWSGEAKEVSMPLYGGVSTASLQDIKHRLTLMSKDLEMVGPLASRGTMARDVALSGPALGPSCAGFLTYRVEVQLLMDDGRTVKAGEPVHLVSPRSLYAHLEGVTRASGSSRRSGTTAVPKQTSALSGRTTKKTLQQVDEFKQKMEEDDPAARPFDACALDLDLPSPYVRPGWVLEGTLRVRPLRPVLIKQLYVALRHKKIGRGWADHDGFNYLIRVPPSPITEDRVAKVVLAKDLRLTEPVDLRFAVSMPLNAVPTLVTDRCSSRWCVAGFARQPGIPVIVDHVVREVNVYTGE